MKEEDGYTGLHHAAKLGNLEIVNMLLETGQVDVNAQVRKATNVPESRFSAVYVVSFLLTRLLSHMRRQEHTRSPSARLSKVNSLQVSLDMCWLQDSGGWTPIIWAAEHKHLDVIKVLLNRGADVNIADKVCV